MMRAPRSYVAALFVGLMPQAALAFPCTFVTECFEDQPCAPSDFELVVQLEDQRLSTAFGDLTIVARKGEAALITLFATGQGGEYLMSITPEAARFSTHLNTGPRAVQYLGTCEGAF
jgi:hypothetical protein